MVVTWRAGGEELCQQDAGEAADEDPVGVEPGQRHLRQGDQYYPYRHGAHLYAAATDVSELCLA